MHSSLKASSPHAGPWCALGPAYSFEYLLCFYLPLVCAFAFNIIVRQRCAKAAPANRLCSAARPSPLRAPALQVYACVRRHSRERRVSRTTSLYLLAFVVVWFPSLVRRLQARPILAASTEAPASRLVPCASPFRHAAASAGVSL